MFPDVVVFNPLHDAVVVDPVLTQLKIKAIVGGIREGRDFYIDEGRHRGG
jgi:hypothetical protein